MNYKIRTIPFRSKYTKYQTGLEVDYLPSEVIDMEKVDNTYVTIRHLNLIKQEIKSEITTHRLETRQQSKKLKKEMDDLKIDLRKEMSDLKDELRKEMSDLKIELRKEMADLKDELRKEMADLRQELKKDMADLRQEFKDAIIFLVQKMDENTAKMRVDIEQQNHTWRLAYESYGLIYAKQEDHEVRLQKLESSDC